MLRKSGYKGDNDACCCMKMTVESKMVQGEFISPSSSWVTPFYSWAFSRWLANIHGVGPVLLGENVINRTGDAVMCNPFSR